MNYTSEERVEIAKIIIQQLGGNRFIAMTGAKHIVATESGVVFAIPGTMTKERINRVRITLNSLDLYDVEFLTIRGTTVKEVARFDGIYAEDIRGLFERTTGLATHL